MTHAAILKAGGLRAKKSFGQNFLEDRSVLERVAALCAVSPAERHVLEIGAGLGALTEVLCAQGAHVHAVERDRDLAPLLRARFGANPEVEILEANALTLDLRALAARVGTLTVCGNLPYHLTSPLIFGALNQLDAWRRLVVMVQKEVAERMVAGPGSRIYGLMSVMLQGRLELRRAFDVGPGAFHPPPKVHSSVVVLTPRAVPVPGALLPEYGRVARAAFAGRRKTLRNTMKPLCRQPDALLETCSVDPGARAETLSVETFGRLALAAAETHALVDPAGGGGDEPEDHAGTA